ncbi:MAG: hypothetical protein ISR96_08760 [Nitrospira sp.]|nr:hypothetical protein [Candidatus Brocadiales bacterium]MBL7049590.1 hypothetical protein [Nitrospira sp.]
MISDTSHVEECGTDEYAYVGGMKRASKTRYVKPLDSLPYENKSLVFIKSFRGRANNGKVYETFIIDRKKEQLRYWVQSVSIPKTWIDSEIQPPTISCKNLAHDIIRKLYESYDMYPMRIDATIEEGVYIKYLNFINKKELSLEVYNDLDIAAIITKDKEILTTFNKSSSLSNIANAFNRR